ncbi:MAG: hypothetical protein R2865_10945 [Deinococcales bacterium]
MNLSLLNLKLRSFLNELKHHPGQNLFIAGIMLLVYWGMFAGTRRSHGLFK